MIGGSTYSLSQSSVHARSQWGQQGNGGGSHAQDQHSGNNSGSQSDTGAMASQGSANALFWQTGRHFGASYSSTSSLAIATAQTSTGSTTSFACSKAVASVQTFSVAVASSAGQLNIGASARSAQTDVVSFLAGLNSRGTGAHINNIDRQFGAAAQSIERSPSQAGLDGNILKVLADVLSKIVQLLESLLTKLSGQQSQMGSNGSGSGDSTHAIKALLNEICSKLRSIDGSSHAGSSSGLTASASASASASAAASTTGASSTAASSAAATSAVGHSYGEKANGVHFSADYKHNEHSEAYLGGLDKRRNAQKLLKDGWCLKEVTGKNSAIWTKHGEEKKVTSPIAFDTNGDGRIGTTGQTTAKDGTRTELGSTVDFDIDGDGKLDKIEWMSGDGDSLLVDDRDGKAASDMSGARLFGDEGGKFSDGYQKLARLDTNGDNQLTGNELRGLKLWTDNGNAKVDAGELVSAQDAGVTRISTQRNDVQNDRGETLMRSNADVNGRQMMTEDVWFGKK
jgi:hypothetical protein